MAVLLFLDEQSVKSPPSPPTGRLAGMRVVYQPGRLLAGVGLPAGRDLASLDNHRPRRRWKFTQDGLLLCFGDDDARRDEQKHLTLFKAIADVDETPSQERDILED